jgi:hypothetical protein
MTPQEQAEAERRAQQRDYDDAFDRCIYRTTGVFSSASIDVIHFCEGQARAASGMSASGQDPRGLEAKPASPTREAGDAQ